MVHRKLQPGVILVNPSTFLLRCKVCGQQWSPNIAHGGAIGFKRKLCPNRCTNKIRTLLFFNKHEDNLLVLIEADSIHMEHGNTDKVDFPLNPQGLEDALEWAENHLEALMEEEESYE